MSQAQFTSGLGIRNPQADDAAVVASLDALRVSVLVLDENERIVYLNPHIGYQFRSLPPLPNLIGTDYLALLSSLIEADEIQDEDGKLIPALHRQLGAGDFRPHDIVLANGATLEAKTRRTRCGGWISMWHDVSETRRTMRLLHNAIALSADAFAFYDPADKLILCNNEYAALFGLQPRDLTGRTFKELVVPEMVQRFIRNRNSMDRWIARSLQIHHQTQGVMTSEIADGTVYLVRDSAVGDGGRVVVYIDVTEQARAEKALMAAKVDVEHKSASLSVLTEQIGQIAEEAEVAKTTLLRTMSHELKTPLNAIIGFSDLLRTRADTVSAAEIGEYAEMIHNGGQYLLRLINQILDLTKLSAGRYELRKCTIDLAEAAARVGDAMSQTARDKSIALILPEARPGPQSVADDGAIEIILRNLIENALTFTQAGGEVRVTAEAAEGCVRLIVADNGPGVASEDLPRIVKPFEQAGRGHADHTDGGGLGLTLVKAMCEQMGGRLLLASEPDRGFTATVELPAA